MALLTAAWEISSAQEIPRGGGGKIFVAAATTLPPPPVESFGRSESASFKHGLL
jgi:hypothetical protein